MQIINPPINLKKMREHIKLCKRNLNGRARCCLSCPFEKLICMIYPDMKEYWTRRRAHRDGSKS